MKPKFIETFSTRTIGSIGAVVIASASVSQGNPSETPKHIQPCLSERIKAIENLRISSMKQDGVSLPDRFKTMQYWPNWSNWPNWPNWRNY